MKPESNQEVAVRECGKQCNSFESWVVAADQDFFFFVALGFNVLA
jgi:hypothetical protein